MMPFKNILNLQISYRWCDVDELGKAYFDDLDNSLLELISLDTVKECVLLETCNRVEIYVYASDLERARDELLGFADERMELDVKDYVRFLEGKESLRHLMKVASGIDSMVVGEDEILGQVKSAYETAKKRGTVHKYLDLTFCKSINVGKKARTRTNVNKGSVSIGSLGVKMLEELVNGIQDKRILVIGAGKMASTVMRCLKEKCFEEIVVANKTVSRAERLAEKVGGEAVKFSRFNEFLKGSDIIISATDAPHPIIEKEDLLTVGENGGRDVCHGRGGELTILDISNPRDVSRNVDSLEGVRLIDLDDLEDLTERNRDKRRQEIDRVLEIIDEELDYLLKNFEEKSIDEVIGSIHRKGANIRREEFNKAINRLNKENGLNKVQKRIIEDMSRSILSSLLADPTEELKEAARCNDEETLETAKKLFKIGEDAEETCR